MAGPSRAQMDRIRAANRARMGLAGVPFFDALGASAVQGAVRSATLRTAFPEVESTWSPSGDTIERGPGGGEPGWFGPWVTAHVVRPELIVDTPLGLVTIAPYREQTDWSGLARIGAYVAAGGVAFGAAWLIGRALS